jgi:ABC-type glycerol-3-phosphate transport system substrate-binding protein
MKKWTLIALMMLMVILVIAACAQASPTTPETEEDLDRAEALIIERCSDCHSADKVFQEDYDREGWEDVFEDMIRKGADVNQEEQTLMIDWLLAR